MRFLAIFILLFGLVAVVQEETYFSPVFESDGVFPRKSVIDKYVFEFGFLEALLVSFCYIIAKLHHERRKVNNKNLKRLVLLKTKSMQEEASVSRLEPYLEDSRSRNSGVEMPLRRMSQEIEDLLRKTQERIKEYVKLEEEFGVFREQWKSEYGSYRTTPSNVIIASIIDAKVKDELAEVKEYIEKEMKEIKDEMEAVRELYY